MKDTFRLSFSRRLRRGLAVLSVILPVTLLLGGCASAIDWLRLKAYRPTPATETMLQRIPASAQTFRLALADGEHLGMVYWPADQAGAPTLLFLHGTFRNLAQLVPKMSALHEAGYTLLAVDYRGWGESSARVPSEASIVADGRSALALLDRIEPDPKCRILYGHSMGTGVAMHLASTAHFPGDYAGLILESAFSSFPDVARQAGEVAGWLAARLPDQFRSIDRAPAIDAPVLMMHGGQDTTVSPASGRRLFDALSHAPVRRWWLSPQASHSNVASLDAAGYQNELRQWRQQVQAEGAVCAPGRVRAQAVAAFEAELAAARTASAPTALLPAIQTPR
ncbi:alpha/beta hydrolase [Amphibiibacter pelophylacis]|uniref:Alpha/beta fold hydrolase n=1 Tax=Amphibiibacter pelophylacis TaxID=1799477 RepID=A0ACC6P4R9_9BURK